MGSKCQRNTRFCTSNDMHSSYYAIKHIFYQKHNMASFRAGRLSPYSLRGSFKKNVVSSVGLCTWPSSTCQRHLTPSIGRAVETVWLPGKILNVLRLFHDGMSARVAAGGEESALFQVSMGVKRVRYRTSPL